MFWLPQKLVQESKNSKQTRFHNRRLQQPNVLFMSSFVSVLFMCLLLENGVCTEKSIILYCPIKIVFFITSSVFDLISERWQLDFFFNKLQVKV